jgi:2,3,4,5-tetrahydropyridine-2-carboxylate N-succinyltransferase
MSTEKLSKIIDEAFEGRDKIGPKTKGAVRKAVDSALGLLDSGAARVAVRQSDGHWQVNQWLKKAVLLSFRLNDMSVIQGGPGKAAWWDKVDSKFKGWNAVKFKKAGFRAVPGCVVRRSAYIAPGVVLMPSFVNLGAYVDSGTMIDTWATVGSCAQIGSGVHLSGGVGIGGVLEPPNAVPVVVGDEVVIGSRSMITQGARVGTGSVLGEGTILNPSIPVIDGETGEELSRGVVPPWCVAVGAQRRRELPGGEFFLPCVLVLRHLDEGERHDKAKLNQVLRDHGVSV